MKIRGIIILWIVTVSLSTQAQSVRMMELENQKKALTTEIENINQLLNKNNVSIRNILSNLNLILQQIEARKKLIIVLEEEIRALDREIRLKEAQIKKLDNDLQQKKNNYAASIQKMYRQKTNQGQVLFILSAENLAQSFRRMLYLREYAGWRKQQAEEIIVQQQKIVIEKEVLLSNKKEKEKLSNTKKTEESLLHQEENTRKNQMATLQKDTKQLQTEMDKKKQQAAALEREISKIIAEEIAQANKAAKAQPSVERKAETKGGYAMTKAEQTLSSDFVKNRGKLPFPLKGEYKIISRFGQQQYGDLKNTRFNSNGIEIKTTSGNNAKAVFDGTVSSVVRARGLLPTVIIRHGNYLTVYSKLEQVYVKQGDKVKTGQDIGKIYTDREAGNETILHFELWKDLTKLNPEQWLNR